MLITMSDSRKNNSLFSGFFDLLIFMDVLGGFAPATVAAAGAISLKKVSTRAETLE
jgi:hypothetical protein